MPCMQRRSELKMAVHGRLKGRTVCVMFEEQDGPCHSGRVKSENIVGGFKR